MSKLTLRRGVWIGLGLLSVVVLSVSGYLLIQTVHDEKPRVIHPPKYDLRGEIKRAKASPEWAELTKLLAKENRPLTRAGLARAGCSAHTRTSSSG